MSQMESWPMGPITFVVEAGRLTEYFIGGTAWICKRYPERGGSGNKNRGGADLSHARKDSGARSLGGA